MRVLNLSTSSFDSVNTFDVEVKGFRNKKINKTCSLMQGYDKLDDGIYWGLSSCTVLKSSYSDSDIAESARLDSEEPIRHGDLVQIDGDVYKANVLGNYSNAVVFDKQ